MPDAVKKMPADRHSVEQRIGVLEELLDERYSCRAYRPDPVPRPIIDRILTAAQRTASWCNSQPWQVVIASGEAKEKFRKLIYAEAASGAGDKAAYGRQALENYNFFGAPHVAIIHTDEALGIYGAIDCGAYVGNFLLAAQALELGTIPQAALARHSGLIRRHFGLGDDRRVVCGISFGFPDRDHKINSYRTSRANIPDAVTFVEE
jgi:nitroreductase